MLQKNKKKKINCPNNLKDNFKLTVRIQVINKGEKRNKTFNYTFIATFGYLSVSVGGVTAQVCRERVRESD